MFESTLTKEEAAELEKKYGDKESSVQQKQSNAYAEASDGDNNTYDVMDQNDEPERCELQNALSDIDKNLSNTTMSDDEASNSNTIDNRHVTNSSFAVQKMKNDLTLLIESQQVQNLSGVQINFNLNTSLTESPRVFTLNSSKLGSQMSSAMNSPHGSIHTTQR